MLRQTLLLISLVSVLQGSIQSVRDDLTRAAKDNCTDEILIFRDGKPIYEYRSSLANQRYDLGEMTGLFWCLAIGSLIDQAKIPSIDARVYQIIPSHPANTTLRALLNHTSGFSKREDLLLLAQVIEKASGKKARDYVGEFLLDPLGIENYSWVTTDGVDTLMLRAEDLAKVGEIFLNQGRWRCKTLISPYWLGLLKKPSQEQNPFFGQQIWLEYCDLTVYWDEPILKLYRERGVRQDVVRNLANLCCREIHMGGSVVRGNILRLWGRDLVPDTYRIVELSSETYFKNLPFGKFTPGCVKSLIGWGGVGQQLVVMPEERFVGVRLSAHSKDIFADFVYHVDAFTKEYLGWVD